MTSKFPFPGGEPYLEDELLVLSKKFKKIFIYCFIKSEEEIRSGLPKNVTLISNLTIEKSISFGAKIKILFEILKDAINSKSKNYFLERFRYNFSQLKHCLGVASSLAKKIDDSFVVYSYWGNELATIASFIKELQPSVKFVFRVHGFDVFEEQTAYKFIPFREFQLKKCDSVFSVSKKGAAHLKRVYFNHSHKINVSYLGSFDCGINPYSNSTVFTIATCSIVRNVKRLQALAKVLMHVQTPVKWYVIGNGDDLDSLKIQCKQLPSHVQVVFVGYLNKGELMQFYKTNPIHLFCSVSSSEGLPFSMIEAISFGIPLLSTNVGGCSEICTNKTGILIDKDFSPGTVSSYLDEFFVSDMNTQEFRQGVKDFWNQNFNAENTYTNFAKELEKSI
ncbi:MAG: glycosyltransferase [Bacteroidetes bacterium]|nr:glycosyltransferase [Bacteroidota bacterium]